MTFSAFSGLRMGDTGFVLIYTSWWAGTVCILCSFYEIIDEYFKIVVLCMEVVLHRGNDCHHCVERDLSFTLIAKLWNAPWKTSKQTQRTATSGQIPTQFQYFRSESFQHFYVSRQLILPHQLFKMTYVMSSASGILLLSVAAFLFNFSSAGNRPRAELCLG